jgi:hypothetical protein
MYVSVFITYLLSSVLINEVNAKQDENQSLFNIHTHTKKN